MAIIITISIPIYDKGYRYRAWNAAIITKRRRKDIVQRFNSRINFFGLKVLILFPKRGKECGNPYTKKMGRDQEGMRHLITYI